jgi:hypothetical protein
VREDTVKAAGLMNGLDGEVFDEEMRAEEDSTENGEDEVESVCSKVKLRRCLTRISWQLILVMLPKSQVRCNTVRLTGNMMRVTKPLASL